MLQLLLVLKTKTNDWQKIQFEIMQQSTDCVRFNMRICSSQPFLFIFRVSLMIENIDGMTAKSICMICMWFLDNGSCMGEREKTRHCMMIVCMRCMYGKPEKKDCYLMMNNFNLVTLEQNAGVIHILFLFCRAKLPVIVLSKKRFDVR